MFIKDLASPNILKCSAWGSNLCCNGPCNYLAFNSPVFDSLCCSAAVATKIDLVLKLVKKYDITMHCRVTTKVQLSSFWWGAFISKKIISKVSMCSYQQRTLSFIQIGFFLCSTCLNHLNDIENGHFLIIITSKMKRSK